MLTHLTITNFAIVRHLDIDWQQGMTTITGETGAGKSIAIDALGLCLGDRVQTNAVRPNTKKAELTATFELTDNLLAKQWLTDNDLDDDENQQCILRRVISAEGRSRAYVNGNQVPLTQLKAIGEMLINIHGQHDHQLITKPNEQLRLVDDYANHPNLLEDVAYYYQQWRKLNLELKQLQENKQQREAQQQLLQYQVKELDEFALQTGEFEQLENDFKKYANSQQLLSDSHHCLGLLSENEHGNALSMLQQSADLLNSLVDYDQSLVNIQQTIQESCIQIEDATQDLKHYSEKIDVDPEVFALTEERYSMAMSLAKKHQVLPEQLANHHQALSQELASLSGDESKLESIIRDIEAAQQDYLEAALKLSESRQESAKLLSGKITASIQELNMPNAQFVAQVSQLGDKKLSLSGIDEIEFVVSMNAGQPLEAMHKVASGGELSRISLAIQVILAQQVVTPALIFDEVDVGISGPTAAMVGKKLQALGEQTQVICVTHLPQVASKGHQQKFVAKLTDGEHTETTLTNLDENGRIREIARLLAGDSVTESSLANAQELLAG